jgi:transcriptional regulator with XRE-family HTH domain
MLDYKEPTLWYQKISRRRKLLDLTQEEAADAMGVSLGTYGRWERGTHKPIKIYRRTIAQAFDIEESELFSDTD